MEVLLILLAAIAVLVFWYLIAKEFYKIAEAKGFSEGKYLWLTFFFGPIGMFLVIALPDRNLQYHIQLLNRIAPAERNAAPTNAGSIDKKPANPVAPAAPVFDDLPDL